jgi:hypothetical protein
MGYKSDKQEKQNSMSAEDFVGMLCGESGGRAVRAI